MPKTPPLRPIALMCVLLTMVLIVGVGVPLSASEASNRSVVPFQAQVITLTPTPDQNNDDDSSAQTATATATLTETPSATPTETPSPTPSPTLTPSATPIVTNGRIIVIEGPVAAINVNIITIYDFDIQIEANNPVLQVIQIGDFIRLTGERSRDDDDDDDDDNNNRPRFRRFVSVTVVNIVFINVTVVINSGLVWRDPGNCAGIPVWVTRDNALSYYVRCIDRPPAPQPNPGGGGRGGRGDNDDDDDDD